MKCGGGMIAVNEFSKNTFKDKSVVGIFREENKI